MHAHKNQEGRPSKRLASRVSCKTFFPRRIVQMMYLSQTLRRNPDNVSRKYVSTDQRYGEWGKVRETRPVQKIRERGKKARYWQVRGLHTTTEHVMKAEQVEVEFGG